MRIAADEPLARAATMAKASAPRRRKPRNICHKTKAMLTSNARNTRISPAGDRAKVNKPAKTATVTISARIVNRPTDRGIAGPVASLIFAPHFSPCSARKLHL